MNRCAIEKPDRIFDKFDKDVIFIGMLFSVKRYEIHWCRIDPTLGKQSCNIGILNDRLNYS